MEVWVRIAVDCFFGVGAGVVRHLWCGGGEGDGCGCYWEWVRCKDLGWWCGEEVKDGEIDWFLCV